MNKLLYYYSMKTVKTTKAKTTQTTDKTNGLKAPAATVARKRSVQPAVPTAVAAPRIATRQEISSEIIAQRAYILWEQQGRPHGRDVANWLLAESQLKQEIHSFTA
jgi:hypothetical protein